ncbi:hypothetical protein R0G64_31440, partial [Pseudomonas otitidis]|nr:hypothetical protein [Pseudomonas otitidis]
GLFPRHVGQRQAQVCGVTQAGQQADFGRRGRQWAKARSELADASLALAERGLTVAQARIRAGKAAPMEALR